MGLWLKCPGCRANNPLSARVCPHCGQSLENLPPGQRVYVLEAAGAVATRKPSPPPAPPARLAPSAPPEPAAPAGKKPKRPQKKKA